MLQVPLDAVFMHAGAHDNCACVWAEVETTQGWVDAGVHILRTGEPMPQGSNLAYLGTVHLKQVLPSNPASGGGIEVVDEALHVYLDLDIAAS